MNNPQIISRIAHHILHSESHTHSLTSINPSPWQTLASFRLTSQLISTIVEPILFETVEIALEGRVVGKRSCRLLDVFDVSSSSVLSARHEDHGARGEKRGSGWDPERAKRLCLLVKRIKIQSLNPGKAPTSTESLRRTSVAESESSETLKKRSSSSSSKDLEENEKNQAPTQIRARMARSLEDSLAIIKRFLDLKEVVWYIWSHSTLYQCYSSLLFSILSSHCSTSGPLSSFTLSILGSSSKSDLQGQLILPPEASSLKGLKVLRIQCPIPVPVSKPKLTIQTETQASASASSTSLSLSLATSAAVAVTSSGTNGTGGNTVAHTTSPVMSSSFYYRNWRTSGKDDRHPHPSPSQVCEMLVSYRQTLIQIHGYTQAQTQTLIDPILTIINSSPDLRVLQVDFRPPGW
ncbi:hypothetical protein D9758_004306 [Tetrapyrgos nigripes]|uniref:Uncharacterized protein n=1 Tax=Tetrapyrgos nigripes TaxID=182062 RepID=A0A8H5GUF7_9AGAR|nr:hypothetical protein D9758_004306 [Tetrapyrgos nigripes]